MEPGLCNLCSTVMSVSRAILRGLLGVGSIAAALGLGWIVMKATVPSREEVLRVSLGSMSIKLLCPCHCAEKAYARDPSYFKSHLITSFQTTCLHGICNVYFN